MITCGTQIVSGSTGGGGASAPAGTGVVTVSGGAFVDPVASAATVRAALDAQQDVFTTRGDLVRAGVSGVAERLPLGANGYVLTSDGTDAAWAAAGGGGSGDATSIQGVAVDATAPTLGQVLTYDGSEYVPTTPAAMTWLALYGGSAFYMGGESAFGWASADYITASAASAAPAFGPGQSIVVCLYPGATPTGLEIVASHGNGATRGWTFEVGRDGASRARLSMFLYGLTGAGSGGSIQLTGSEWSSGAPYVIAVAFQADKSVRFSVNGGSVVTITAATGTYVPPTSADTLSLGAPRMHSPSFYPLTSATIGEVRWYSTIISDADLVAACAGVATGTIPDVATGTVIARLLPSDFAGGVRVKARDGTTWILKGGASVRPV